MDELTAERYGPVDLAAESHPRPRRRPGGADTVRAIRARRRVLNEALGGANASRTHTRRHREG
jgi:hypothetical protein